MRCTAVLVYNYRVTLRAAKMQKVRWLGGTDKKTEYKETVVLVFILPYFTVQCGMLSVGTRLSTKARSFANRKLESSRELLRSPWVLFFPGLG